MNYQLIALTMAVLSLPSISWAKPQTLQVTVTTWAGESPTEAVYDLKLAVEQNLDVAGSSFKCYIVPMPELGGRDKHSLTHFSMTCKSEKKDMFFEVKGRCIKDARTGAHLSSRTDINIRDGEQIRSISATCGKHKLL